MLVYGTLSYTADSAIKKMTEEEYAELRVVMPWLGPDQNKPGYWTKAWFNDDAIRACAKYKLGVDFDREPPNEREGGLMFVKLQDRIRALELLGEVDGHRDPNTELYAKGAAVTIAIPDQALLKIDKVTWLENACTEELQQHLDDGWRILAVCPPNAQRRPDYILGKRTNFI